MKHWLLLLPITFSGLARPAFSHGIDLKYRNVEAMQIQATYDSGEPMIEARVTVYAPNDPETPWLIGNTDKNGYFLLIPDRSLPGNWDIKVRQSGHGRITTIPIGEIESANVSREWSSQGSYSPLQKAVMAVMGIWGFIGTALYFSGKKKDKN
ncbi:MAG: carboxypeptidase regulatory-like domain-containing protein [Cyanobacteria bacterium SBLK]|nr:carboxypeptidase regulatory-like domain-containing protein [Cyanobacteria bacterium SBLK]